MEEASMPLINFELKAILDEIFDNYITEENLNSEKLDIIFNNLTHKCIENARLNFKNNEIIKRSINMQTILRAHKNITTDFKNSNRRKIFSSVNEYYDAFLNHLSLNKKLSNNHETKILKFEKQKLAS